MGFVFKCWDLGMDFRHVIEGNSKKEVSERVIRHFKSSHNFSDKELKNPEVINSILSEIKLQD